MIQRAFWSSILFTLTLCIGGVTVDAQPTRASKLLAQADGTPGKGGLPAPPQASPLREKCETALKNDAEWFARFKGSIRPEVHKEKTERMLNNNKHVVIAYVIIWAFSLMFLEFMWLRQQRLSGEVARLEAELSKVLRAEAATKG